MEDYSGKSIRGYELQDLLGHGGFGAVYVAHQPLVKRDVVIKIILPQHANQPEFIRRFEAEAQIIARLEHLHIVPLYDYWRDPSGAYLVMRWLRGGNLQDAIRKRGGFTPEAAARLLDQIASALTVAHRNGVIHRDIKPANILLDEEGNAYLTDFGIAKDLSGEDGHEEQQGAVIGSPAYISPEQIKAAPVGPQADIYGLGIVMYEVLTGYLPFTGQTSSDLIIAHLTQELPPPSELNLQLPGQIDEVIKVATAKNPGDRYPDTVTFATAFREAIASDDTPTSELVVTFDDKAITQTDDDMLIKVAETTESIEITLDTLLNGLETIQQKISNPYKGLRPFEEADAGDFFGREALVSKLIQRLQEDHGMARFLAVVGPSGSGKSSVVKAGLIPELKRGAMSGSKRWFYTEMVPSQDPFQELATTLLSIAVKAPENLATKLREDENALLSSLTDILPEDDSELVLVIDQFEEIYTQSEDENLRGRFMDSLRIATTSTESRLRVLITLRADFYDRPLLYPEFGNLMRERTEVVLPMTAAELERAIIGPADRVGMFVEPTLVAAVVADIREEPGALPLLQYALTEVFERRSGSTLTLESYREIGAALGALARRAEEIHTQMPNRQQEIARQLFLRLVTLGEGTEDTRRRVRWSELMAMQVDNEVLQSVLDTYGKYRLLTFDRDPQTREPTVEVAHEALIRQWGRLREWLDDSREDLRLQRRLASATKEWESHGEDKSFLASGIRLQQLESLLVSQNIALTPDEVQYIKSSIAEREAEAAAEAARQAYEIELERRNRQRLRALLLVFVVAAILASGLAIFAFDQQATAEENEETAIEERNRAQVAEAEAVEERNASQESESRLLSTLALQQLEVDPVASINLALRALPSPNNNRPYVPEAEFALISSLHASHERHYLPATNGRISDIAFGSEQWAIAGSRLVIAPADLDSTPPIIPEAHQGTVLSVQWQDSRLLSYDSAGNIFIWENGSSIASYTANNGLGCAAWHPNGEQIILCDGTTLLLWSPVDATTTRLTNMDTPIQEMRLSPEGRFLAIWGGPTAGQTDLVMWDIENNEVIRHEMGVFANVGEISWSPDGAYLSTATGSSTATLWPTQLDAEPVILEGHNVSGTVFVNNEEILTWSEDGSIRLWATNGEQKYQIRDSDAAVNGVALSTDKQHFLAWFNDRSARIYNTEIGTEVLGLREQNSNVVQAAWRDENTLATAYAAIDGYAIRIWHLDNDIPIDTLYGHTDAINGLRWPDAQHLLSYASDGSVRLWRVFTEDGFPYQEGRLEVLSGHQRWIESARWLNDNTILTYGRDGTARRWHLDSGEVEILVNESGELRRIVWSPDGTRLLTFSDEQGGQVWDFASQTVLFEVPGPIPTDGAYWPATGLLISRPSGQIELYDETGSVWADLSGHDDSINSVAFHQGENRLATAGKDNTIMIWQLTEPTKERQQITPVHVLNNENRQQLRLQWSIDGRRLLSAGYNGDITLWDTLSEEILLFLTSDRQFPATSVRFSPDENYIAASIDTGVYVWTLDGELVWQIREHENIVPGVRWFDSPRTLWLLTWDANGLAYLWDFNNQTQIMTLSDESRIRVASFNSDGTHILTAGDTGEVVIWQTWPILNELIETAKTCCLTRPLSAEQQQNFNVTSVQAGK